MRGACDCGASVRGALGFSNEKSRVNWVSTENRGALAGSEPLLPFWSAIQISPRAATDAAFFSERRLTQRWSLDKRGLTLNLCPAAGCAGVRRAASWLARREHEIACVRPASRLRFGARGHGGVKALDEGGGRVAPRGFRERR